MVDMKKVIKGLECCGAMSGDECRKCPYGHECRDTDLPYGMSHLAADALELLKKQEPVIPKLVGVNMWECGACGYLLGWEEFTPAGIELCKSSYCPGCGRKVAWDDDRQGD